MFLPENENNHIAQILGPEEAVWDLNKSVTYRTPIKCKNICSVTNESAIDNEGFFLVRNRDRLSVVSITDGQLQKKVVDFESLDFLRIKNNRIKSIFDNTGNLWVGTNGEGSIKKQIQILSLNILQKQNTP